MTTTGAAVERSARRTGHPVRRFVVVVGLLAVVAVVLWWTGLANPRLTATTPSGSFDWGTGVGVAEGSLRNDAPTAVEITEARLEASGVNPLAVTGDGRPLVGSTLGGGEDVALAVHYQVDGCVPTSNVPSARLVITTRTVSGLERTVRLPFDPATAVTGCR